MTEASKRIYHNETVHLPTLKVQDEFTKELLKLRKAAGEGGRLAEATGEMIDEAKRAIAKRKQKSLYGHSLKEVAEAFEKHGSPIGGAQND